MSIPTYQVFNIDEKSDDVCGEGKSGYLKRTNYILDSFKEREISDGKVISDEGERQYDGTYNMEQRDTQPRNKELYTRPISPVLIIINISCVFIFIYILYQIVNK